LPKERTKNGRSHTLPLPPLALEIIRSVPHRVGRDHLFGERSARGFTAFDQYKIKLDTSLGDKVAAWRFHDLRRSAATRMCDLGVAPHVVEQILNHVSGHRRGIGGVYNRSEYQSEVRAALILWDDHIRAITAGGQRKILAFSS
jgi:integrase